MLLLADIDKYSIANAVISFSMFVNYYELIWKVLFIIGFGDYTDILWWKWFKQLVLPIDH